MRMRNWFGAALFVLLLAAAAGAVYLLRESAKEVSQEHWMLEWMQATPAPTPEPTATPDPEPTATPEPGAEETSALPEVTPAAIPTEPEAIRARNDEICAKLRKRFQETGDQELGYVKFFNRTGPGVFAQILSYFAVGLPENYDRETMDVIILFYPGFLPQRGEYEYHHKETENLFFEEDMIDTLMDRNPNTIVAVMSADVGSKYIKLLLRTIETCACYDLGRTVCGGWSAGGNYATFCAASILLDHPDFGTPWLVYNDCNDTAKIEDHYLRALNDSDVRCLVFSGAEDPMRFHRLFGLENSRIPTAVVQSEVTLVPEMNTHIQRKLLAVADNAYGFLLGHVSELPGSMYDAVYRYGYYDYDRGETVWDSAEEVYRTVFAVSEEEPTDA